MLAGSLETVTVTVSFGKAPATVIGCAVLGCRLRMLLKWQQFKITGKELDMESLKEGGPRQVFKRVIPNTP